MNNTDNLYTSQRFWSDKLIPHVSPKILSGLQMDPIYWSVLISSFDQDTKEACDLIVTDGRIEYFTALRLRNKSYVMSYPFDFTIRNVSHAGAKTEFVKIHEGYSDIMFYGFRDGITVPRWIILDLDVYRSQHYFDSKSGLYKPEPHIKYQIKENTDNRNNFYAYDLMSFNNRDKLVLAHSPGYYADVDIRFLPKSDGTRFANYNIKTKGELLDGIRF